MGKETGIAWTDHTCNPLIGCTRVSPGCENCYAESLATTRMGHLIGIGQKFVWGPQGHRYETKHWKRDLLKWDREARQAHLRRKVFLCSLSDIFEDHPAWEPVRPALFALAEGITNLDLLMLTKRPENILRMIPPSWRSDPLSHIWYGTTGENDAWLWKRWHYLSQVPAKVRFISWEPALGSITVPVDCDWLIAGCESDGHGLGRPMDHDWVRMAAKQCKEYGTAFFVKQMAVNGKLCKDVNQFPADLQIQEFPQ